MAAPHESSDLTGHRQGDEVLYDGESSKPYKGRVTHVYAGGAVRVDWTCWPRPWFNGPYEPWEVRHAG